MVNVNFWLDTRREMSNGEYPVKLSLSDGSRVRVVSTGVTVTRRRWDDASRAVIGRGSSLTNRKLSRLRSDLLSAIPADATLETAVEMAKRLCRDPVAPRVTLGALWDEFARSRNAEGTRRSYECTKSVVASCFDIDAMPIGSVTAAWAKSLDEALSARGLRVNTRAAYVDKVKAVVSRAVDEGLIQYSPLARVKTRRERTAHRCLDVARLRHIRDEPLDATAERVRDAFMLSFYLIGMNAKDMFLASEYDGSRLRYARAKTGKPYDIKVEPEAAALIEKYRGRGPVLDLSSKFKTVASFTTESGRVLGRLSPGLTMYWARHTWATLAAELDVPMDVISASLGHSFGARVTSVYVAVSRAKVDAANRLVLDYVASDFPDAASFLASIHPR